MMMTRALYLPDASGTRCRPAAQSGIKQWSTEGEAVSARCGEWFLPRDAIRLVGNDRDCGIGGHTFYGRWFQGTDPAVNDFEYRGADIIAGPNTAATGPAEEFNTDNEPSASTKRRRAGRF